MNNSNIVSARFATSGSATAAVDWFLNQGIDRSALVVEVVPRGERRRPPRAGDNRRTDLEWTVSVDVDSAKLSKRLAIETMKREGGVLVNRATTGA